MLVGVGTVFYSHVYIAMSSTQDLTAGVREGFYRIELNKTVWEIPKRYQMLSAIGTGAYGQVW